MGYVYLLNMIDTDFYKVGVTKRDINQRVRELQTGCPDEIILINQYRCKNYIALEKWLHRVYSVNRMEGEWFILSKDKVNNFIDECEKGDETVTLLINENPFFK